MSVIAIFLIFSMLAVLWFDGTGYIIPNWLVGLLLVAYPVAVMMAHTAVDWKMSIAGAAIVLVIGYIIFAKKFMGGGDIKLITVCSLWVGLHDLMDFLIIVTLMGGVFAVGILCIRKIIPFLPKKPDGTKLPRIFNEGAPVPYGVAIAFGFLLMMWSGKVPVII